MADDYEAAAKKLGQIGEALHGITEAQLLELGHAGLEIIVMRTRAGLDADRKPFAPYSEEYKKVRAAKSLQTSTVDLAVTGHMIGASSVFPGTGEVVIGFNSTFEAKKAAAHNFGVDKQVSVKAHSRGTHVDKKGRRVSRAEVRRDAKRKNKRVYQRSESVGQHTRHMKMPKRNWFDIRSPEDEAALTEMVGIDVAKNVERVVAGK